MASIVGISVTPSTIVKGQSAKVTLQIANPDRVSKVYGVDEAGAKVTATYDVHENLSVLAGAAQLLPSGAAPPGTIVVATDASTDALTPSPADITQATLQTT